MQARTGKTMISLAVAALAAQATAEQSNAGASSASMDNAVTAAVAPVCILGPVTAAAGANAAFVRGTITVYELIDPSTALVKEASLQIKITAMCNFRTRIGLASENGGMTRGGAIVVPYTIVANWNGVSVTLDTSRGRSAQQPTSGAINGALTLNFHTQKSRWRKEPTRIP